jgi:two-component system nitrogen regulation response regulator GlnG
LNVWIVDDDESIRWVLEKALSREGMKVACFPGAAELLNALSDGAPDVLISDIRMPGINGLELMERVRARSPKLPVIIMTAHSDLDAAVASYKGGAFEYLPKPFDVDGVATLVRRAVSRSANGAPASAPAATALIGDAPAMQDVFRAIGRLSQSHITVLITGESGTGKELVARALHENSPRASHSFIAINTAAIPKDLLESEFFGHERGSFTGAQAQRKGRFEQADGGTLFLDEIGDMPADLQTRLLRVLQNGEFYRVGGLAPIRVDVRVIAATHQDLEKLVAQGRFREDLYHRLNVIRVRIPALREHAQDIPALSRHFLQRAAEELKAEPKLLRPEVMERLKTFDWPGNVRQLENVCRWLTVMAPGREIHGQDLLAAGAVGQRAAARRGDRLTDHVGRAAVAGTAPADGEPGSRRRPGDRRGMGRRATPLGRARAQDRQERPARHGDAAVRTHHDRSRARRHARPAPGSRAASRLGPQHADAQDQGAGDGSLATQRLERAAPGDDLVEHGVDGFLVLRAGLEVGEVLEIREQRKLHRDAHVGNQQFAHHQAQVLDRARTTGAAVADEAGGLVVPLAVQEIDRVLQRGRSGVVVLRRHEDEGIETRDLRRPDLGVRLAVLAQRRRQRLVEQRQLEVGDVDQLELRVAAPGSDAEHPFRHRLGLAARSRAADDDTDLEHGLNSSRDGLWSAGLRTSARRPLIMHAPPTIRELGAKPCRPTLRRCATCASSCTSCSTASASCASCRRMRTSTPRPSTRCSRKAASSAPRCCSR